MAQWLALDPSEETKAESPVTSTDGTASGHGVAGDHAAPPVRQGVGQPLTALPHQLSPGPALAAADDAATPMPVRSGDSGGGSTKNASRLGSVRRARDIINRVHEENNQLQSEVKHLRGKLSQQQLLVSDAIDRHEPASQPKLRQSSAVRRERGHQLVVEWAMSSADLTQRVGMPAARRVAQLLLEHRVDEAMMKGATVELLQQLGLEPIVAWKTLAAWNEHETELNSQSAYRCLSASGLIQRQSSGHLQHDQLRKSQVGDMDVYRGELPVEVRVQIELLKELDIVDHSFAITCTVTLAWPADDPRYPPDFVPRVRVRNCRDDGTLFVAHDSPIENWDGFLRTSGLLNCTLDQMYDVHDFPFDSQTLMMRFQAVDFPSSDGRSRYKVVLVHPSKLGYHELCQGSDWLDEWEIEDLRAQARAPDPLEQNPHDDGANYVLQVVVQRDIQLQSPIFTTMIIPLLLIQLMTFTAFALQFNNGEGLGDRLGVTITLTLTTVSMQTNIRDTIPKVPYVTSIDKMLLSMIVSQASNALGFAGAVLWKDYAGSMNETDDGSIEGNTHVDLVLMSLSGFFMLLGVYPLLRSLLKMFAYRRRWQATRNSDELVAPQMDHEQPHTYRQWINVIRRSPATIVVDFGTGGEKFMSVSEVQVGGRWLLSSKELKPKILTVAPTPGNGGTSHGRGSSLGSLFRLFGQPPLEHAGDHLTIEDVLSAEALAPCWRRALGPRWRTWEYRAWQVKAKRLIQAAKLGHEEAVAARERATAADDLESMERIRASRSPIALVGCTEYHRKLLQLKAAVAELEHRGELDQPYAWKGVCEAYDLPDDTFMETHPRRVWIYVRHQLRVHDECMAFMRTAFIEAGFENVLLRHLSGRDEAELERCSVKYISEHILPHVFHHSPVALTIGSGTGSIQLSIPALAVSMALGLRNGEWRAKRAAEACASINRKHKSSRRLMEPKPSAALCDWVLGVVEKDGAVGHAIADSLGRTLEERRARGPHTARDRLGVVCIGSNTFVASDLAAWFADHTAALLAAIFNESKSESKLAAQYSLVPLLTDAQLKATLAALGHPAADPVASRRPSRNQQGEAAAAGNNLSEAENAEVLARVDQVAGALDVPDPHDARHHCHGRYGRSHRNTDGSCSHNARPCALEVYLHGLRMHRGALEDNAFLNHLDNSSQATAEGIRHCVARVAGTPPEPNDPRLPFDTGVPMALAMRALDLFINVLDDEVIAAAGKHEPHPTGSSSGGRPAGKPVSIKIAAVVRLRELIRYCLQENDLDDFVMFAQRDWPLEVADEDPRLKNKGHPYVYRATWTTGAVAKERGFS